MVIYHLLSQILISLIDPSSVVLTKNCNAMHVLDYSSTLPRLCHRTRRCVIDEPDLQTVILEKNLFATFLNLGPFPY